MSGTSRERWRHISPSPPRKIKIAKCELDPRHNVEDIYSVTLQKSEVHFAFLIFKGAFCAFDEVTAKAWSALQNGSLVIQLEGITILPATFIHHK